MYFEHHLSCQLTTCCFAPPIQGDIPVSHRSSYFRLCRGAAICMYMIDSQNGGNFRRYGFAPPPSRAIHAPSCCRWLLCCVLKSIDAHCMCQRKSHSVKLLTHMDQCSRLALNLDQCSRLALNFPDRSLDNCMWRRSSLRRSHELAQNDERDHANDSQALTDGDITKYRGLMARIRYLSHNTPDLIFAAMQACFAMANKLASDLERVKAASRVLVPLATDW